MVVTIHQPDFIPWIGFFDRWSRSDVYVVLDDVQFLRRGWHHRDRIKTANGPQWLTVPIMKKGRFRERISEVRIDDGSDWRSKHLSTLAQAYAKCSGFEMVFPELESAYRAGHTMLVDFNLDLLARLAKLFDIKTPMAMASDSPSALSSTARLVNLTMVHLGRYYLTGMGSRDYLEERLFREQGIEVLWQEFEHPSYPQRYGDFVPGMSAIDCLMNLGKKAKELFHAA